MKFPRWPNWLIGRPKSSGAQVVQAVMSVALFGLAVFGYFYTVQPVYTRQRAEEAAARLEQEAARYRAEIEHNKIYLSHYETITRRYVIEQFSTRVISVAENMYGIFGIGYYGANSFGGLPPTTPYGPKSVDWGMVITRKISFSKTDTGRDIVRKSLGGDEFYLLKDLPRQKLIAAIDDAIKDNPAFSQPLGYQVESIFPAQISKDGGFWFSGRSLSVEEQSELEERQRVETKRFDAAHVAFVNAIGAMKRSLLTPP